MPAVKKGLLISKHRTLALVTALLAASALMTLPGTAQAVVCTSTPAGLIAHWPGNGSTADVAHGRNGSLVGGATYVAGEVDQAFSFDGVDSKVSVPDDPDWTLGGNDFTVDTWVNFTSLPAIDPVTLIAHDPGAGFNPKWILWWRPGYGLQYFVNDPTEVNVVNAAWTPTLSHWYHVAVTRSGSTFTLYIDGSSVATAAGSFSIPDSDGPLTIGSAENNFWLNGSVDEPEIYQRALSGTEINAIFTAGSNTRCAVGTSSVTLDPIAATAAPGSTISLNGTLSMSSGTVTGTPIHLFRSVDGAAETSIGTVFAASDGSFSSDDAPPNGDITYRAAFDGATDLPAANGWAHTSVQQQKSSLTLGISDGSITFGQSIKLKAHLHGGETNRSVSIFSTPAGGHKQLLKKGTVDKNGVLEVVTKPSRNTSFVASYSGDTAWKGDTSGSVAVTVTVRWGGKSVGGYATANGYRLYHFSSICARHASNACPTATFTLAPNHAGQRVSFLGKYCKSGRCVSDSGRYRLDKHSQVTVHIFYNSTQVIGFSLYLRFRFDSDRDHKGATSKVIKEKITA